MRSTDNPRLFIAITLPGAVRDNISSLIRDLDDRLKGIRWTPPSNIHLTLKFLGPTPAARIPRIREVLDRAAGRHLPLAVRIAGMGQFPAGKHPRVIWAGVGEGKEALAKLAGELDRDLAGLGFPWENRPYTPHLTLGRIKRGGDGLLSRQLAEEVERRKLDSLGSFNTDMIVLLKSILTPRGAVHEILSRHNPGGTEVLPE